MKQKIIIKVQIACHKCRTKALKIAASASGVVSVTVQGDEALVVTGRCVDPVALTATLRKKVGVAILLSVEEIKDPPKKVETVAMEEKKEKKENGGGEEKEQKKSKEKSKKEKPEPESQVSTPMSPCGSFRMPPQWHPCNNYYYPQQPQYCMYEFPPPDPSPPCSIM